MQYRTLRAGVFLWLKEQPDLQEGCGACMLNLKYQTLGGWTSVRWWETCWKGGGAGLGWAGPAGLAGLGWAELLSVAVGPTSSSSQ